MRMDRDVDNFILINTMSSSYDMSVRDDGSSAKWHLSILEHLRKVLSTKYIYFYSGTSEKSFVNEIYLRMELTIAANQGHSYLSAFCPPTMRRWWYMFRVLDLPFTAVLLPQTANKKPS